MRIKCLNCGYSEEVTLDLFLKIIGGATVGFGFWSWTSFLFAGTGFAMAICVAIFAGGAAMLAYKDEIVEWIIKEGHECNECGCQKWVAVSPEIEKEMNEKNAKIAILEKKAEESGVGKEATDSIGGAVRKGLIEPGEYIEYLLSEDDKKNELDKIFTKRLSDAQKEEEY